MNVAIGAARLGIGVTLVTAFGNDEHGAMVRAHIEREGITLINRGRPELPTNVAVATLASGESVAYAFRLQNHTTGVADALADHDVSHLHVGSLAAMTDEEWQGVLAAVEAARPWATVSYDPNCRPEIGISPEVGRVRVEAFVAASDLIKASDEDLAWLYPGESSDAVAARWLAAGARMVVITQGGSGPIGYAVGVRVAAPAPRIAVTDTVGAGDSFMAAMLAWCDEHRMLGRQAIAGFTASQVEGLLQFAARAAAITCTRVGANPPSRVDVDL